MALDFDYREQMIYWTDVTTQGSMIRRMHINGSNVQVRTWGSPWGTPGLGSRASPTSCPTVGSSLAFGNQPQLLWDVLQPHPK